MDYLEYSNFFMESITEEVIKEYGVEKYSDTSFYTVPSDIGTYEILFSAFKVSVLNKEKRLFEIYEYMPRVGEFASYCSISFANGLVKITHERILRNNNDNLIIFASGMLLEPLEDSFCDEDFFAWPYKVVLPSFEETLAAFSKKGHFQIYYELPQMASGEISPENLTLKIMETKNEIDTLLGENRGR